MSLYISQHCLTPVKISVKINIDTCPGIAIMDVEESQIHVYVYVCLCLYLDQSLFSQLQQLQKIQRQLLVKAHLLMNFA